MTALSNLQGLTLKTVKFCGIDEDLLQVAESGSAAEALTLAADLILCF